jgi:transcriptional regulator with XRE-family HTH domain
MHKAQQTFIKNIVELRKGFGTEGLTLTKAAALAGMSLSFLSRLESGERFPDAETLGKLADLYGVKVADLFRDDGAQERLVQLQQTKEQILKSFKRYWLAGQVPPSFWNIKDAAG